MKRLFVAVLGALVTYGLPPAAYAGVFTNSDPAVGGVVITGSEYVGAGGSAADPGEVTTKSSVVYSVVPYAVCDVSEREGAMCHPDRNIAVCADSHPEDANNHWQPYEVFRSTDGGATWTTSPTLICLNAAVIDPGPPPVTAQMVRDHATALLPKPILTVQPGDTALLGVPVIAATPTTNATPAPITLLGRTVRVRAHADTYEIDFDDGATTRADTPGRPYSSAAPCTPDDCDAYLHHTYVHPGRYRITLTASWHAEYQVDGGPWQDVPGAIDTVSVARDLTVVETTTALVGAG